MVAKKFQNPKGGLNEAGREHFKKTEGANLKRPVKEGVNPRRISFAGRFGGMDGPMKDDTKMLIEPKINGEQSMKMPIVMPCQ